MNVNDLKEKLELRLLAGEGGLTNEIKGGYCGDLLSWVISRASGGDAWLTVMGNINAVAVSTLADCSCIVLTDNAPLDENAKAKANSNNVPILQTDENSFDLGIKLAKLLGLN